MATLYGARGVDQSVGSGSAIETSDLYTIDPATGAATSVGAIGYAVGALAPRDTTRLWGITADSDTAGHINLISINKATGAGTLVGPLVIAGVDQTEIADMESLAGVLYAVSCPANPKKLLTVDPATGAPTVAGDVSDLSFGELLAFSTKPGGTDFYAVSFVQGFGTAYHLWSLAIDGTLTDEGDITGYPLDGGLFNPALAMATDPADPTKIYALVLDGDGTNPANVHLVLIDASVISAPAATVIGATTAGMSGLCWDQAVLPAPPSAPTLTAARAGAGRVTLAWTPGDDGGSAITGFKVYRGTVSGGETLLTPVGVVTGYGDTLVDTGTTYFYKVSAVSAIGESGLSNELSATPVAGPVLAVAVARGTDPGDFVDAATLTTTNSSRRSKFAGYADGLQSQMVTVRITQEGPSARTEIHGVEVDVIPLAPGLEGDG